MKKSHFLSFIKYSTEALIKSKANWDSSAHRKVIIRTSPLEEAQQHGSISICNEIHWKYIYTFVSSMSTLLIFMLCSLPLLLQSDSPRKKPPVTMEGIYWHCSKKKGRWATSTPWSLFVSLWFVLSEPLDSVVVCLWGVLEAFLHTGQRAEKQHRDVTTSPQVNPNCIHMHSKAMQSRGKRGLICW